jgi:hypothetical protein
VKISIILMFFRKNKIEKIISNLEPLNLDSFLEVEGLSGRIAPDKLRYSNGKYVSCVNFAEAQLLTRELSNGFKIRLPTLREDYIAFSNLDDGYRENVLSSPPEWKSELLDGSFLLVDPEVRRVDNGREYDFHGAVRTIDFPFHSKTFDSPIQWLGISKDRYDRSAVVRTHSYNNWGNVYAACMVPPLSRDCIGLRLFSDE